MLGGTIGENQYPAEGDLSRKKDPVSQLFFG
jgi:hypothetical protein